MWIVDHLPKILPHARIILYGYKSEIVHGHVHLRVSELGRMLRTVLELKENMIQVRQCYICFEGRDYDTNIPSIFNSIGYAVHVHRS